MRSRYQRADYEGRSIPISDRREPRIKCNIPVVLHVADSLIMVPCDNISIQGMFVKGSLDIEEGTEVSISFRLPVESRINPKIKAEGHVVWINKERSKQDDVPVGFGIQLEENIGESAKKRLMTFIESNKEKPYLTNGTSIWRKEG